MSFNKNIKSLEDEGIKLVSIPLSRVNVFQSRIEITSESWNRVSIPLSRVNVFQSDEIGYRINDIENHVSIPLSRVNVFQSGVAVVGGLAYMFQSP